MIKDIGTPLINPNKLAISNKSPSNKRKTQRQPKPPSAPLLGHLHLLKEPVDQSLYSLSSRYGPVLFLSLGQVPAVLVSEECIIKNDASSLMTPSKLQTLMGGLTTMSTLVYGMPSVQTEEALFITRQLQEVKSKGNYRVNLTRVVLQLTHNVVLRAVHGKPWTGSKWIPKPTIGSFLENAKYDVLPSVLKSLVICGASLKKSMFTRQLWIDGFVQRIIDECRVDFNKENFQTRTLVEELLDLQDAHPKYYTDQIIRGILALIITGEIYTTSHTIQWAMFFLLDHPEVLEKARKEIEMSVADQKASTKDYDLSKLTYLCCIINETLRLHPPGPLFVPPYFTSEGCTIGEYHVPKGTIMLVNARGSHSKPKLLGEPSKFKPERWLNESSQGESLLGDIGFKFFPLSGSKFATRTITTALATLIQFFDWVKVERFRKKIDEHNALEAICTRRSSLGEIVHK